MTIEAEWANAPWHLIDKPILGAVVVRSVADPHDPDIYDV